MPNKHHFYPSFTLVALLLLTASQGLAMDNVILWDNHGTITGFADPNNLAHYSSIYPNVERVMRKEGTLNIICSGTSKKRDYDPELIIAKFTKLMQELPITIALFCPDAAGKQCWVITKQHDGSFAIFQAHKDERYAHLVGTFKKPDSGMITVIQDIVANLGILPHEYTPLFIGDSWQDVRAAHNAKMPFVHAGNIHRMQEDQLDYSAQVIDWCHGQPLIDEWKQFFATHNWQELIHTVTPIQGGCGIAYDLPNYLHRANESVAVVDMRTTLYAQPHYHPDLEVYIVLQGTALIAVGSDKFYAKQGDVITVWPFNGHYIIPDQNFVLACVNVPPYTPASHIPLYASDEFLDFDYDDFVATTEQLVSRD